MEQWNFALGKPVSVNILYSYMQKKKTNPGRVTEQDLFCEGKYGAVRNNISACLDL